MDDKQVALKSQYLDECDKMLANLRCLYADLFLFQSYEGLLNGAEVLLTDRIDSADIFVFAMESMGQHLNRLDDACRELMQVHDKLIEVTLREKAIVYPS